MFISAVFLIFSLISLNAGQNSNTYASVNTQVENRWQAFQANKEFKKFTPGKSNAELSEDFENIRKTRLPIKTAPEYEFAQHLITEDLVRAPGCVAFGFNNTVPYYNASTICLGDQHYIACEGTNRI